jgi:hypothetical protein
MWINGPDEALPRKGGANRTIGGLTVREITQVLAPAGPSALGASRGNLVDRKNSSFSMSYRNVVQATLSSFFLARFM